jgi:hypothetical protein
MNKQWRYSGICIWLFFRKCVTLIPTEEDYDFGGVSFVVSHTSFSSVPGCCHLHCCTRINSICFHRAGSVIVTLYSLYIFYRLWFRTSVYSACVRFPACLQAYFKILSLFPPLKFLYNKPTRCINWKEKSTHFAQFLCPSPGVFHWTQSNGICHTGFLTASKGDQDGTTWSPLQAVSRHINSLIKRRR